MLLKLHSCSMKFLRKSIHTLKKEKDGAENRNRSKLSYVLMATSLLNRIANSSSSDNKSNNDNYKKNKNKNKKNTCYAGRSFKKINPCIC